MNDRDKSILWAQAALEEPRSTFIFDTETTGLDSAAEICSIAIIDGVGAVLLKSLVKPSRPIPPNATAIHGITNAMVQDAPSWAGVWVDVWPGVSRLFRSCKRLVSYNMAFDWRMVRQCSNRLGYVVNQPQSLDCCMLNYAAFVGEYNYRQGRGSWKWQKLVGGDHTALGDCWAALELMITMACANTSEEEANIVVHRAYQQRNTNHGITDRSDNPPSA